MAVRAPALPTDVPWLNVARPLETGLENRMSSWLQQVRWSLVPQSTVGIDGIASMTTARRPIPAAQVSGRNSLPTIRTASNPAADDNTHEDNAKVLV